MCGRGYARLGETFDEASWEKVLDLKIHDIATLGTVHDRFMMVE